MDSEKRNGDCHPRSKFIERGRERKKERRMTLCHRKIMTALFGEQSFSFFLGSRVRYSNFFRTAGGDTHTGGFLRSCDNAWPEFHGHTIFMGTDGKSKIISQVDSGPGERLITKELEN